MGLKSHKQYSSYVCYYVPYKSDVKNNKYEESHSTLSLYGQN